MRKLYDVFAIIYTLQLIFLKKLIQSIYITLSDISIHTRDKISAPVLKNPNA